MKRVLCVLIFLTLAVVYKSTAQNYIGKHKDEIFKLMGINFKNFRLNKDVVNHAYKYMKFEDHISEQTILFFLSDDDHCTFVRWMSDYANINEIIEMLNRKYTSAGKNTWSSAENNNHYIIRLKEEEWFFTVTFKLKIEVN